MQCKQQFRNLFLNISSRAATAALAMAVVFALTVVLSQSAQAQKPATGGWTEKILYTFGSNSPDGIWCFAGLVFDGAGNLYGTTYEGGASSYGTVFELAPAAGGGWTEDLLRSFDNGRDGGTLLAGLIFDRAGNLYGATMQGGTYGLGTVFELAPTVGGGWTETVLYNFAGGGADGAFPYANLIFDSAGNLYGTNTQGGSYEHGTAFELSPREGGGWTEKILHTFGNGSDGSGPYSGLIFDAAGNLYGTTEGGGAYGGGTAFELTPTGGGGWSESILHNFGNGADGVSPYVADLIFDTAGNLYGPTPSGGAYGDGTVFELTPAGDGNWTEQVLHSFGSGTDGAFPYGKLIRDATGNLYGTTNEGGAYTCSQGYKCGTVFELMPTAGGAWTETVLHNFAGGADGNWPSAGMVFDAVGNLYGTTGWGGTYGDGTVFELTHASPCARCSH